MPSKNAGRQGTTIPKPDENQLESDVLSVIEAESHRPNAIFHALNRKYDQNAILKVLLKLEKEGKAERESKKAWIAKGKGKEKQREKDEGKDKSKK
jgi:hypothetical protein